MRRRWLFLAAGALAGAGAFAAVVIHLRREVVPPGCRDPRTLALVAARLPPDAKLERIKVLAGGPLAFQFICAADMGAMDVHYTSRWSEDHRRQVVTVSVSPVLMWMRVK
ncbi:MAG: hypothetical protein ABI224_18580 [Acetobacteraceae bacterium]